MDILKRIDDFLVTTAWEREPSSLPRLKALGIKALRLFSLLYWGYLDQELGMRAMSLVYTTILSLVPLLAVSFSVLKALGVQTRLELLLYNVLAPLGEKGIDLSMQIITFVENVNVGVLGAAGLSILIYTLISNISKMEAALNYIWNVHDTRSLAEKFSNYLSVLLVGPVLIFSAIGLTGSLMSSGVVQRLVSMQPFGTLIYFLGKILPYIIVCGAFSFIYVFLPNAPVHLKPALAGGLFAAILWETAGWAFASFVVSSSKYSLIYSGFAIGILSIIWLDLSWMILLIGARVSFYYQYPLFFSATSSSYDLTDKMKERFALVIMYLIGCSFHHDGQRWTFDSLIKKVGLPVSPFKNLMALLKDEGLVMIAAGDKGAYIPSRDTDQITVSEILDAVRTPRRDHEMLEEKALSVPEIDEIMKKVDNSLTGALGGLTLKDLIFSGKDRSQTPCEKGIKGH